MHPVTQKMLALEQVLQTARENELQVKNQPLSQAQNEVKKVTTQKEPEKWSSEGKNCFNALKAQSKWTRSQGARFKLLMKMLWRYILAAKVSLQQSCWTK